MLVTDIVVTPDRAPAVLDKIKNEITFTTKAPFPTCKLKLMNCTAVRRPSCENEHFDIYYEKATKEKIILGMCEAHKRFSCIG